MQFIKSQNNCGLIRLLLLSPSEENLLSLPLKPSANSQRPLELIAKPPSGLCTKKESTVVIHGDDDGGNGGGDDDGGGNGGGDDGGIAAVVVMIVVVMATIVAID
jgi:hypothetical protein